MRANRAVLAHLHIAAFLLGGTALFSKLIPYDAWDIIAYRALFCAIAIGVFSTLIGQSLSISKKYFNLTLFTSFLFTVHWVGYFQAMQLSTVAIGMIAMFTFPVMTVFLEPLFLNTKLHKQDIAMGLLVVLGVLLLVPELNFENEITLGIGFGLISAVAVAFRNIIVSKHLTNISAYSIMFNHAAVAALLLLPFSNVSPLKIDSHNLLLLVVLGIVFTAIPHTQKTFALRKLNAKSVSMVISLQVVYGSLFAFLILGEDLSITTLCGGFCILTAGFVESYNTLKKTST